MQLSVLIAHSIQGQGHTSRCLALREELAALGVKVTMMAGGPEALAEFEFPYDAVVADYPTQVELTNPIWRKIPTAGKGVQVRITDMTVQLPGIDVVVFPNPGGYESMVIGAKRVFAGTPYVMLRREIRNLKTTAGDPSSRPRRIEDTRAWEGMSSSEVAVALTETAVAITYGGQLAQEAAALGCAVVGFARSEGEHHCLNGLRRIGAAMVVTDEAQLVPTAERLEPSRGAVAKMSWNGLNTIDAAGAERVARELWTKLMP